LLCAENLLNNLQAQQRFTIAASSEATGYTVDRLANGRRHLGDRFEPNNTNTDVTLTTRCDTLRAADFVALDRAGNHRGYRYQLLGSNDNFTTSRTVFDVNTIPTVPGGRPSEAYGCVTDEGAWLKTFTADAFYDWRVTSKAMGAGLKPQVVGLWVGKAWQPTEYLLQLPLETRGYDLSYVTAVSPYGWRGKGQRAKPRSGTLRLGFPSFADVIMYERHIEDLALRGYPFWLCWQKDTAPWRSILAELPEGRTSLTVDTGWSAVYPTVEVSFIEVEPAA